MHKFLRAIGFSQIHNRKQLHALLRDSIETADSKNYVSLDDETLYAEFLKEFSDGVGLAVRGEFDEENRFIYEYFFPYRRGTQISSAEDITIERHAEKESYAGVCDEMKVGVSLIFYLQNMIPYIKIKNSGKMPIRGTTLNLAALSVDGMILMPIQKDEKQKKKSNQSKQDRLQLMQAARRGDENAMETLTLDDMDIYSSVSRKILKNDVFSLVDTCFMPFGVECDMYSVVGEILACEKTKNDYSKEELWLMTISCNDLVFDVCMNAQDLYGEPAVGRRFKGSIWLQGYINFPEE